MKKIVFFILLLTLSFRLTAQIDYLEPVKPFTTYTGELGEYYRNVFSLLNTGFQQQPYARFVAIPSFSPEYAMSVEKKGGRYCLVSNTLSRTYWQAEKGTAVAVIVALLLIIALDACSYWWNRDADPDPQSKNPWIGIALLPVMISGIVVGIASYATVMF